MNILESASKQDVRCPRCGNRDFPGGIPNAPFSCPVIGCNYTIDPEHMPLMLPDPQCGVVPQAGQDPSDPLIYDRDAKGELYVKGVYGDPETVTVPTMVNGRAVMSIGPHAFEGKKNLRRVTLPDTVAVVGEDAFCDCTDLESITFGTGLKLLDRGCLRGCSALMSVVLPDGLLEIGREAFANCGGLEHVSMGGHVQTIRDNAFLMCASLSRLSFVKAPVHTAVTAFAGCYSLDPSVEEALFPVSDQ